MRTEYVVGFLHNENCVVLIKKARPEWQSGRLNGVGGHIEPGETALEAMTREFKEEAGIDIDDWKIAVVMTGQTWRVHFFTASRPILNCTTQTDEPLVIDNRRRLHPDALPNLRWLIPLCTDTDVKKPIYLRDITEPQN